MEEVNIHSNGIIRNILELNYTPETVIKEYLNNVLSKNDHSQYSIEFNLRNIRSIFGFEFIEQNANGFSSLEEIKKAYSIADSQRKGTNNMGYGIFSPLAIRKDHDACNLFIQNTPNGRFYSITKFNAASCTINTEQGVYSDKLIKNIDISLLEVQDGTRSLWLSIPEIEDIDEKNSIDIIKIIIKNYKKFVKEINIDDEDILTDITELGKYYYEHLSKGVSIYYGKTPINPIDILKSDTLNEKMKKTYYLSLISYDGKIDYRIKQKELDDWSNLTLTASKPIGEHSIRKSNRGKAVEQKAMIHIHDIDIPDGKTKSKRGKDKKIWVKVDGTYIFNEVFPLNGWPNIRVVLKLTNSENNSFDHYISPNANKSRSMVNKELKDRINNLIKYTVNVHFKGKGIRKNVPKAMQQQVWLKNFGKCFEHKCYIPWCKNTINVWDFQTGHNIPERDGGETIVNNLKPICAPCNSGMGCNYTIESWTECGKQ